MGDYTISVHISVYDYVTDTMSDADVQSQLTQAVGDQVTIKSFNRWPFTQTFDITFSPKSSESDNYWQTMFVQAFQFIGFSSPEVTGFTSGDSPAGGVISAVSQTIGSALGSGVGGVVQGLGGNIVPLILIAVVAYFIYKEVK